MKIFGAGIVSNFLPDIERDFRVLVKKLILELIWKVRDKFFFEVFDRIIRTCGLL